MARNYCGFVRKSLKSRAQTPLRSAKSPLFFSLSPGHRRALVLASGDRTMPRIPYRNRAEAGRLLAGELAEFQGNSGALLFGVAMGGIAVAAEVSSAFRTPLQALVVRKLEAPTEPALTIGAIAPEGVRLLDDDLIRALGVSEAVVDRVVRRETAELERQQRLFERQTIHWKNRTVILIDDAAESGWTMLAALRFARKHTPHQIVAACPVASAAALERLRHDRDRHVFPAVRERFSSMSDWYWNLPRATESEVVQLLERNRGQANE